MKTVNQARRKLFIHSALMASGALLASSTALASSKPPETTKAVSRAKKQFAEYFHGLGYAAAVPKPLITPNQQARCHGDNPGPDHLYTVNNGHLLYDDGVERVDEPLYVLQGAARVEDIPRKGIHNVLPFFTIGLAASNALTRKGEMIDVLLDFLITKAGLLSSRLSITSTELALPYLDQFKAFGITPDRIRLRKLEAAKAAAQGSGWLLNPVTGFGGPSVSIEYRRGHQIQELGEIMLREAHWAKATTEFGGFGLERLAWAQTGHCLGWEYQVDALLTALRAESQATGTPLPIGYDLFAASR